MAKKDPRVDAYIVQAKPFALPILKHLRRIVHAGCPSAEETIKWSMPHFEHQGILCGMAAFKAHCAFWFWNRELVLGDDAVEDRKGMQHFGRITSVADLPEKEKLIGYVRKAAELNERGIKKPLRAPRSKKGERPELALPDYFVSALDGNAKAAAKFNTMSYSCRREYVDWITGAKRDETRQKRLDSALASIVEGKPQNWKYLPQYR